MQESQNFLSVAETLAKRAGDLCLEIQQDLGEIHYKSKKDVVTRADIASEKLIVEGIRKAFPTHSIRTEEAGVIEGSDPRYLWIIDPVDGTVNFSRGIPLWGISIALHFEGKPLVAAVNLPKLGELYTACRGGGAFMNGKAIHVSRESDSVHAIVSNGDFNVGDAQKINEQIRARQVPGFCRHRGLFYGLRAHRLLRDDHELPVGYRGDCPAGRGSGREIYPH